jgi:hypothetical protein
MQQILPRKQLKRLPISTPKTDAFEVPPDLRRAAYSSSHIPGLIMTSKIETYPADLILAIDGFFLTDREGDLSTHQELRSWMETADITAKDVEDAADKHRHCFEDGIGALAWCAPYPGAPRSMNIILEFELSDEWLPDFDLESAQSEEEKHGWGRTLLFHGPAIAHVAKGLSALPGEASDKCRCFFDFSAFYGGSICVMMPLDFTQHYKAAEKLLCHNGLPFPHSHHAQIEAAARLSWVFPSSGFPTDIISNANA